MLSFHLRLCVAGAVTACCAAVSAPVRQERTQLTRREEQQLQPGSAVEQQSLLDTSGPALRPGCRAQPRYFNCTEDRRAPCKLSSDTEDRGCGQGQKMCDYHLYRGSNLDDGGFIPCCEKHHLLMLLDFVDRTLCGRVEWALSYGSLLAGVREEDLIEWDVDVDIIIHEEDRALANELLNASLGDFELTGWHPPVTRIYLGKQESVHLDVWWVNTYGGCSFSDDAWFAKEWYKKPFLGECKIHGRTYPCPTAKLEILDYLYGGKDYPGGSWRNTSGSSTNRCEDINDCEQKTHGFSCRAPPDTSCTADHDTGMTCVNSQNETLLPDPVPANILAEVPQVPGCYVLLPFGCYAMQTGLLRPSVWARDFAVDSSDLVQDPRTSPSTLCQQRRVDYNKMCGIDNTHVVFVESPSIFRRSWVVALLLGGLAAASWSCRQFVLRWPLGLHRKANT